MVTYTDEEGEVLVGLVAQEHAHIFPETTVFESKRFIGLKYCDKNVQNAIIKYPYVVVNEHEDPTVKIRDRRISFEEIYIHMLKNVHEIARERLQKNVNVAVITVPAYFGENQRKATKMAAIKAGFKTVHLINEPTAAAIAYQHRNKTKYSRTLLIYDFGGGTFDTSIVKAKGLDILVLAIDGDCHLGGTDIDFNLQKHVKEDIEQSHRSFTVNKVLDRRIKCISKQNKEQLSRAKKCTFNLPDVHRDLSEYQLAITRKEFEDINEALFAKTLDIVKRCISGAKLNNSEIDAVVLVGGCSRIPKIKQLLADYFGIEKICSNENPDHLVAQGAVIYSNALGGDKSELKLLDVLSRSLGVECLGDKFVKMIKKNSPIPYQITKRYCTSQDNQKVAAINLYEGERSRASNNTLLRKYSINMVTMGRKGEILIDVTFSLNNEGILKIDADEVNTDNKNTLFVDITTKN